jgi:protein-tyrosine-phosphatase
MVIIGLFKPDARHSVLHAAMGGIRTIDKKISPLPQEVFDSGRGMASQVAPEVLFVCVGNRVRSVFAEFYMRKMLCESGSQIVVSSAGFMPKQLKDLLTENNIPFPEPFYNRPMAAVTKTFLQEKGFSIPEGWRSKELSPEMIKNTNLLITALGMQKDELSGLYEGESHKIFSVRELLKTEDYLFFEDFTKVPMSANFWQYCEEDPQYVTKVLRTWEQTLVAVIPNIIEQL